MYHSYPHRPRCWLLPIARLLIVGRLARRSLADFSPLLAVVDAEGYAFHAGKSRRLSGDVRENARDERDRREWRDGPDRRDRREAWERRETRDGVICEGPIGRRLASSPYREAIEGKGRGGEDLAG